MQLILRLAICLLLTTPCLAQTNYNLFLHLPSGPNFQSVPCLNCGFGSGATGKTYFAGFGLTLTGSTFAIDPTLVLLNGNPQINGLSIFNGGNIIITNVNSGLNNLVSAGTGTGLVSGVGGNVATNKSLLINGGTISDDGKTITLFPASSSSGSIVGFLTTTNDGPKTVISGALFHDLTGISNTVSVVTGDRLLIEFHCTATETGGDVADSSSGVRTLVGGTFIPDSQQFSTLADSTAFVAFSTHSTYVASSTGSVIVQMQGAGGDTDGTAFSDLTLIIMQIR